MKRAIIDKTILDSLIRAKVATIEGCRGIEPLPVSRRLRNGSQCNWHVPGWLGDERMARSCSEKIEQYLSFLQAQFDIAEAEER